MIYLEVQLLFELVLTHHNIYNLDYLLNTYHKNLIGTEILTH